MMKICRLKICRRASAALVSTLVLLTAAFLASCGKEEEEAPIKLSAEIPFDRAAVLAKTGDDTYTVGDFINGFVEVGSFDILLKNAQAANETSYLVDVLDQMEDAKTLAARAEAQGLVDTEDMQDYMSRLRIDKVIDLYYVREVILKTHVTEQDLRDHYEKIARERFLVPRRIKFRWIFISADKWGWDKAEERANEVAEALQGKREFDELVYAYSDSESPHRFGDYGWYKKGDLASNPALEGAAFSLEMVGQFTGPIRAGNGFHFIELTGVQDEQVVSFENSILVVRDEVIQAKVQEKLAEIVENGMKTMGVERHFELLDDPEADDSATLFRVEDFRFPLGRFRRAVMVNGLDRRSEQEKYLDREVRNAIIYQTAVQAGYGRLDIDKIFRPLIDQRLESIYYNHMIDQNVRVPEREILALYEKEKEALVAPTRIHPYWILVRAEVPADALRYQKEIAMRKAKQYANRIYYDFLLRTGEPFTDLARKYSHDQSTKLAGGDLGIYEGGPMGHRFDEVAFSVRPGEVSHPVELDNGYCLIWVRERFPPRQLTFEEARPDLSERLLREKIDELRQQTRQDLREGREWTIDRETLEKLARFLLEARDDTVLRAQLIR